MKRSSRCSIGGSFGANEIPLRVAFFYLFNEAEAGLSAQLLDLSRFVRRSALKTLSGGEFGWGDTAVTSCQFSCIIKEKGKGEHLLLVDI